MARRTTKLKNMSAEAQFARKDAAHQADVDRVGAEIGMPQQQRRGELVGFATTRVDGAARPIERTARKLTRTERLHRSGAIDKHHVTAIDRYVAAAETAYGACVKASGYGDGGISSPAAAASSAHTRQLKRIGERGFYRLYRGFLPTPYVEAFERIVLDNHPLGDVGSSLWPTSSAGAVSGLIRDLVRTCADNLCAGMGIAAEQPRVHLAATMKRFDQAMRTVADHRPVSDAVAVAILPATVGDALYLAPDTLRALMRENALKDAPAIWGGLPIVVVERWAFGWLVQTAPGVGR